VTPAPFSIHVGPLRFVWQQLNETSVLESRLLRTAFEMRSQRWPVKHTQTSIKLVYLYEKRYRKTIRKFCYNCETFISKWLDLLYAVLKYAVELNRTSVCDSVAHSMQYSVACCEPSSPSTSVTVSVSGISKRQMEGQLTKIPMFNGEHLYPRVYLTLSFRWVNKSYSRIFYVQGRIYFTSENK
jgi:hypothetical protein